jgi:cell division protein FtsB
VKTASASSGAPGSRHRWRRAIEYALVLIGCVVFLDALVGEKGLLETIKKREEYRRLEAEIEQARIENQRLAAEAERLRSDPRAIEELARKELGLIKPGERLFILKDRAPGERR